MTAKRIITTALLLIVAAAVFIPLGRTILRQGGAPDTTDVLPPATVLSDPLLRPDADVDVVYYFMTTERCDTCRNIEAYTRETVETRFTNALDGGGMIWRMVNLDEPVNSHFIRDYQLFTKSVVLVRYRDGQPAGWKNLDLVWTLIGDKTTYQNYVEREIRTFFGAE